ncbi:gluconate 2-dehydrogenase subunit 3 family protein [Helicobacter saguini]|uniref:Gluconate 2-dehydrogenase subunit 3 family protein n=1 Tax=Helicobacter saguini TaxID=1548018 RepID=A0A347VTH3_9HELI|nr:gluconate 2-dehydrogenase subunit 3 family protein [Helicobacter saguini]MWV62098.1 gluconate 2-dehydrogenase subunit 3 family protein [Helicobacter saguini]MWV67230.1 gluconate 2-dehydrogenase subunit 3 family protein [Helicobacter saguini]MWV69583.1 gluconate 2-dehydrogenase subunit 3 family protein [Helicobacter saguini]MWV70867.1 gluconate 2-dehydrogenase subunit 3 family protein [Helicobacter saguini]TLD94299.1 gluconate 2-dehydrogenase subunit 3 family protein [Helicobacter saguini]
MDDKVINRRNFFKISLLAGGAALSSNLASAHSHNHGSKNVASADSNANVTNLADASSSSVESSNTCPPAVNVRGRMFFQQQLEFDVLSAACERIYPKDESGPGAIELEVPFFIDNQLAGAYGFNAREYMQGPFRAAKAEYGYQSPMYRRDIFLLGIHALEDTAQKAFQKGFADIDDSQKDRILKDFEANKGVVPGISSKEFFTLLRDMTMAGVLADPIYKGNLNMQGWKMMEYPGAQLGYSDSIDSDSYEKVEPQGLVDMN